MRKSGLSVLGISRNEELAYESMIRKGLNKPAEIAKEIGISRENGYHVLSLLEKRGLVTRLNKRTISYKPVSPEMLIEVFEEKKREVAAGEELIRQKARELENLYQLHESSPSVSYFEGIGGLKKMYDSVFYGKKPNEVVVFGSLYDKKVLNNYFQNHIRKLSIAGIDQRVILPEGVNVSTSVRGIKLNREIKRSSGLSLPAEISVYNNKVIMASFKRDKVGAIIESKDLAESLKQLFEHVWKGL